MQSVFKGSSHCAKNSIIVRVNFYSSLRLDPAFRQPPGDKHYELSLLSAFQGGIGQTSLICGKDKKIRRWTFVENTLNVLCSLSEAIFRQSLEEITRALAGQ